VSIVLVFYTWRYKPIYRYACHNVIRVPMLLYCMYTPIVLVLIHVEIQSYIEVCMSQCYNSPYVIA